MRPIIGVTFKTDIVDNQSKNYTNAVKKCGGEPIILFPGGPTANLAEMDGLLLTGGGDIHPDYFDEKEHPTLSYVNKARDELEIRLYQKALETDIPVFGICRGIQVMSVAMGGSLYQDIPSQFPPPALEHSRIRGDDSQHPIDIDKGSLLSQLTGVNRAKVNSAHHQAVKDIGEGFVVTARAKDGVIEAMENPSKRFMLGVQYHPERMLKVPDLEQHATKLFTAFINACA